MNIALDMMGGDYAPLETIKGVKLFLSENQNEEVELTLIGDENKLLPLLDEYKVSSEKITVVHASEVIEMQEHPTKALKEKQQSSISIGFHFLATGKTDAFISAGNTGAMLVGSLYSIKAISGVSRPAIGAYIPGDNGKTSLIVDVGLNADCKPENLSQFALLGSLFSKYISGLSSHSNIQRLQLANNCIAFFNSQPQKSRSFGNIALIVSLVLPIPRYHSVGW